MFDFEVQYIFGEKYTVADILFWRPLIAADKAKAKGEKNIDDFMLKKLNNFRIFPISLNNLTLSLADKYFNNSQKIATYLTKLCQLPKID